ncbi:biopolymer transporter ExbD [Bdellovibrio bacteriovorus]|uniref:Adventurous gliding motility protein S n=1 Tax=Bdellovibrio bacteriovorus TaxID=959 RepID=A0A150WLB4_BDEBC|nr:biopolymer transporter ExbD [Bdellovibrio bacteriovorus]KYG62727.1 adventurous gliding motility protein S [Bdellovibrio bacteriovorus]KYG64577.1 adventurous gliding motility protein S [Bdellovibrio bacteriovorus]
MISDGILKTSVLTGTLEGHSIISPRGAKGKRNIAADLLLTALIDAFSILVIFLLMNFSSTGEILMIGKNQELPKAHLAAVLERNPVIKIDDNKIYVEDKLVTADTITAELLELRKKHQELHPNVEFQGVATIQADRRVKYEFLNQIILGMNQAGYSDIKFAVVLK